jgi:formyl-CoA transferase
MGTAHRLSAPYQAFRASDGYFTVGAANNKLWGLFAKLLGQEGLAQDERFRKPKERLQNRAVLEKLIEAVTITQTRAHWLERCEAAGIPAGPIYSIPEALGDPHAQARGMTQEYDYPGIGRVKALGNPVKMSRSPAQLRKRPPSLGEDNEALLLSLGFSSDDIFQLKKQNVIS